MVGLGLGIGIARPPRGGAAVVANPNLLLWTDDLTKSQWLKTAVVLGGRGGSPSADLVQDQSTTSTVRQTSATSAILGTGATFDIFDVAVVSTRYSVTATFDLLPYTFSIYMQGTEAGVGFRLRIDLSGGFIRCSLEDIGDVGSNYIGRAQLEQAATASAYSPRTT